MCIKKGVKLSLNTLYIFSNPKSKFRNPKLLSYYFKRNLNFNLFVQVNVSDVFANKFWFSFKSNPAAIYFKAFFLQCISNLDGIDSTKYFTGFACFSADSKFNTF